MYNKIIMIGNLTRDIDLKYLPSGSAVAKSSIATSYKYKAQDGSQKEEVCFLEFTIFGRIGEVANQYLRKGSKVLLEGRLILDQWVGQDGSTKSRHSLRVDEMKMLDSKNSDSTPPGHQYQTVRESSSPRENQSTYTRKPSMGATVPEIDIDDEIPFNKG